MNIAQNFHFKSIEIYVRTYDKQIIQDNLKTFS